MDEELSLSTHAKTIVYEYYILQLKSTSAG